MEIIDYTIAEFLGIFLIYLPVFVFLTTLFWKGIFWIIEKFFEDETTKNFFHHHFHYKDRRGNL